MADEAQPDDSEPKPERQAELRAAYEANVAAGRAPYEGVHIRTRDELQWVMRQREWTGEPDAGGKKRADFRGARFGSESIQVGSTILSLASADFSGVWLVQANLSGAHLSGADLSGARLLVADLSRANLRGANLTGATLNNANLSGANLYEAKLSGTHLGRADLTGADFRFARMDVTTFLVAKLDFRTRLANVVWNGVPVMLLTWDNVPLLGDEYAARQSKDDKGEKKDKGTRLGEYTDAVQANRQVATLLRSQGLNEHSDRFAYRAQRLQRALFRRQTFLLDKGWQPRPWQRLRWLAAYLGSWVLALLAGYGYRLWRILVAYGLVLVVFMAAYYSAGAWLGGTHLSWYEAFVVSLTAIHGRVFFTQFGLDSVQALVAAIESVVGIVIEGVFVAMLIQRFFAR